MRGGYQDYVLDYHPLDVVGWDGYVYPYTFNIADFEPKAGRLHQPPPAHQNFQGPNFVICSFCPRMLDWDPMAIALPYHHSNVQSEEMIYYVDGQFGSRKGVDIGAITLHPSGLPHGPQPGLVEKSLGVNAHGGARGHVRHLPAAEADDAVARPRRPELRLLLVRGGRGDVDPTTDPTAAPCVTQVCVTLTCVTTTSTRSASARSRSTTRSPTARTEIAELKADVRNGQDVVIFAPRRYGKTSLVWRASQELRAREGARGAAST